MRRPLTAVAIAPPRLGVRVATRGGTAIARARRDENDLFMLFVFSELMGVPNPAAYYTLELQPLLLERFHEWHQRMGMEHSPLDGFRCC